MKCVKKDNVIKRVTNEEAKVLVSSGWSYISKTEWKNNRSAK